MGRIALATPPAITPALAVEPGAPAPHPCAPLPAPVEASSEASLEALRSHERGGRRVSPGENGCHPRASPQKTQPLRVTPSLCHHPHHTF